MDKKSDKFGPADSNLLYLPLPDDGMRLLKPVPTSTSEELEFDLSVHDICSEKRYYALSYVWGQPVADRFITCNGQKIGITENLFQALRHLRNNVISIDLVKSRSQEEIDTANSYLWIDQICINQADLQERIQQIKRMREIFSRAVRTVIWYGPDISEQLAEYMLLFGKITASQKRIIPESFDISMVDLPDATSPFWSELHDFLTRAWTTRVWVIQEAALSPIDPAIICGSRAFGLRGLCLTAITISWIRNTDDHLMGVFQPIDSGAFFGVLRDLGSHFSALDKSPRRVHLADLLYSLPTMHASDSRDLVYGVLGLTHFADEHIHDSVSIVPDYDRNAYELFRAVARYAIDSTGSLRILAKTGEFDRARDGSGVCQLEQPSWTPMFHTNRIGESGIMVKNRSYFGGDMTMYARRVLKFHATPGRPARLRRSSLENKLILKGLRIDAVKLSVARVEGGDHVLDEKSTSIKQWEAALEHFGIDVGVPPPELCSFVEKFFAVTHPFSWDENQAQGLRSNDSASLRYCCEELRLAYQCKGGSDTMPAQILQRYIELNSFRSSHDNEDDDGEASSASLNLAVENTFFITQAGYMGFGARALREGDCISILYGGQYAYALEICGDEYHFLGEVFIKECSDGEAVPGQENGQQDERQPEWITIH